MSEDSKNITFHRDSVMTHITIILNYELHFLTTNSHSLQESSKLYAAIMA